MSTILQKVRFCGSFFVPPMAETQARHLRGILRMPSQCTLARFGTSVPLRPLTALAVRQVPEIEWRKTSRLGSFFALVRLPGLHRITASQSSAVHPVHAVVFRARFAARHDSRLGQYFCALSRLMSLAYRQVSFVPFGAKFSQNSLPDTSWSRLNSVALKGTF